MTFQETLVVGIIVAFVAPIITAVGVLFYRHWKSIWRWQRRQFLKLFPVKYVITLSIEHNDQTNIGAYYTGIKEQIISELHASNLTDIVTLRDFSDIYNFSSVAEAERFRQKKKIDLIVWGKFSDDRLQRNGVRVSTFTSHFTYGFSHDEDNKEQIGQAIKSQIDQIIAKTPIWEVRETNSIDDVRVIGNEVFVISLFTIGLTFGNQGKFELTENIFRNLRARLIQRNDSIASVFTPYLIDCYKILINRINNGRRVDYQKMKEFSRYALEHNERDINILSSLALAEYKTNEKDRSRETVKRMLNHHQNSTLSRINAAFMDILDKKYENALKKYRQVCSKKKLDFNPTDVLAFLGEEYKTMKEPALLFASGSIAYYLTGDVILAKTDIENFLKHGSLRKHGVMFKEGKQLLAKINQDISDLNK